MQTRYSFGKLVDELRKVLRELRQKIFFADAGLLRSVANSVLPERRAELPGFGRLVLTRAEPALTVINDFAMSCALKLVETTASNRMTEIARDGLCCRGAP